MNRNFPHHFSVQQLRVSNSFGWIHATDMYVNDLRELREANLFGWFYATGGRRTGVDKAGFHAIAPMRRFDAQA